MGYFDSIYSSELPHRARAVYMYLKDRANKDGTGYDPMVGRMSGMLPGLFENGGVYCHASAFKILMDCRLGRGDKALETLKKIMPDSEKNPSAQSGA